MDASPWEMVYPEENKMLQSYPAVEQHRSHAHKALI